MDGPERLRGWLKRTGTHQTSLASTLGVSQSCVSDWVAGLKTPGTVSVLLIAKLTRGRVPATSWLSEGDLKRISAASA